MISKMKHPISILAAVFGLVLSLAACGSGDRGPAYEVVVPAGFAPGSAIPAPTGSVILTLSGDISVKNAGDTLQFDMPTLEQLGLVKYTVNDPHLEVRNTYTGVLMSEVVKFAGISESASIIHTVALDDYEVDISLDDIEKWPVLLATRTNGNYMSIDQSGPTRIIFPYDSFPIDPKEYHTSWAWNLKGMEVR